MIYKAFEVQKEDFGREIKGSLTNKSEKSKITPSSAPKLPQIN